MLVADARVVARAWVDDFVRGPTGGDLVGAFLTGSAAVGPGDRELPATSDVDLLLVTAGAAPAKIGKLWHRGVLLDVSGLPAAELGSETVAGTFYLAPFVAEAVILNDPTGALARLRAEVRPMVDRPEWVRRRVADVRARITAELAGADPTAPLADQVLGWVFPASLPSVLLLVAAGRPPTVRTRYLRCRELLAASTGAWMLLRESGSSISAPLELYERLLDGLGCAKVTPGQVRDHLDPLADTLRVTAEHARTPFPFSSDLRPDTWRLTVDGSAELVNAGRHREAVWWVLASYARCVLVLTADAPRAVAAVHQRRLDAAAGELIGFRAGDGPGRAAAVRSLLVEVDGWAEALGRTRVLPAWRPGGAGE